MSQPQTTLLGRIALHNNYITEEQLGRSSAEIAPNPGLRIGQAMVKLGYLRESQVQQLLRFQNEINESIAKGQPHTLTIRAPAHQAMDRPRATVASGRPSSHRPPTGSVLVP